MNKFDTFPTGKKRKEIIEQITQKANDFTTNGEIEILDFEHYTWVDSSLDGPERIGGRSFADSFQGVLPEGEKSFKNYIETTLKERKGKAIGVEFGGIGSRLFRGFTPGFFARSIAVSLIDHRGWSFNLARLSERDKNIFDLKTYESLKQRLDNEKIDLIIERMGQGLEFVPVEPYTISKILQIWYDLLREEGVMFVQTPVVFNNLLEVWVTKIKEEFKDIIEIEYQKGKKDAETNVPCGAFRLHKLPGAPKELPLLDPRIVKKIPKAKF